MPINWKPQQVINFPWWWTGNQGHLMDGLRILMRSPSLTQFRCWLGLLASVFYSHFYIEDKHSTFGLCLELRSPFTSFKGRISHLGSFDVHFHGFIKLPWRANPAVTNVCNLSLHPFCSALQGWLYRSFHGLLCFLTSSWVLPMGQPSRGMDWGRESDVGVVINHHSPSPQTSPSLDPSPKSLHVTFTHSGTCSLLSSLWAWWW